MISYVSAGYTIYWRFPTAAERLAYVAKASEIDRVAHQLDDDTVWILKETSPVTWAKVGGGSLAEDEYPSDPLTFYILAKA